MVIGTSSLGNLYQQINSTQKTELVYAALECMDGLTVFDSAGKYGAGLALESLGEMLSALKVSPDRVLISNKLGWKRMPLLSEEPTFELEVWKGITHDAEQKISYRGILECFEEGNELLQGYSSQLVSVHDPDEYLNAATSPKDYKVRFEHILQAYSALQELKNKGEVLAIGVGAKDWRIIEKLYRHVAFDWVMIANSMTIYRHPQELVSFMKILENDGVGIINSAVFQSGFLVGGSYFDYSRIDKNDPDHLDKFIWREKFFLTCSSFEINPAHACIQFGLNLPGVNALSLSPSSPDKVRLNANYCEGKLPEEFWNQLKEKDLISELFEPKFND